MSKLLLLLLVLLLILDCESSLSVTNTQNELLKDFELNCVVYSRNIGEQEFNLTETKVEKASPVEYDKRTSFSQAYSNRLVIVHDPAGFDDSHLYQFMHDLAEQPSGVVWMVPITATPGYDATLVFPGITADGLPFMSCQEHADASLMTEFYNELFFTEHEIYVNVFPDENLYLRVYNHPLYHLFFRGVIASMFLANAYYCCKHILEFSNSKDAKYVQRIPTQLYVLIPEFIINLAIAIYMAATSWDGADISIYVRQAMWPLFSGVSFSTTLLTAKVWNELKRSGRQNRASFIARRRRTEVLVVWLYLMCSLFVAADVTYFTMLMFFKRRLGYMEITAAYALGQVVTTGYFLYEARTFLSTLGQLVHNSQKSHSAKLQLHLKKTLVQLSKLLALSALFMLLYVFGCVLVVLEVLFSPSGVVWVWGMLISARCATSYTQIMINRSPDRIRKRSKASAAVDTVGPNTVNKATPTPSDDELTATLPLSHMQPFAESEAFTRAETTKSGMSYLSTAREESQAGRTTADTTLSALHRVGSTVPSNVSRMGVLSE